ncbi:MAG: S26 family signal peptidase [Actinomycetes bacterium]
MEETLATRRPWWHKALLGLMATMGSLVVANQFLLRCEVDGQSMIPVLLPGDRVLLRRRRPMGTLRVGMIVGFIDPRGDERLLLKRISSLQGTEVTVVGENLAASTDSRTFGPLEQRDIEWVLVRRYSRAPLEKEHDDKD